MIRPSAYTFGVLLWTKSRQFNDLWLYSSSFPTSLCIFRPIVRTTRIKPIYYNLDIPAIGWPIGPDDRTQHVTRLRIPHTAVQLISASRLA